METLKELRAKYKQLKKEGDDINFNTLIKDVED